MLNAQMPVRVGNPMCVAACNLSVLLMLRDAGAFDRLKISIFLTDRPPATADHVKIDLFRSSNLCIPKYRLLTFAHSYAQSDTDDGVSQSGTPRHSARRRRGTNQQPSGDQLFLLSHRPPGTNGSEHGRLVQRRPIGGGRGPYLKMRKSWSISESPWNSGFLVASSAKMVPMLHTSTGVA